MSEISDNDFLLAALRCGRLRIKLLLNEMDQVGLALKSNLIDHESAVLWLDECGLMQFVDVEIRQEKAA
jgi:hypothetical protein